MANTREYDVVVAGAGNAAIVAALAAHEKGAKVLVLEKAPPEWRGGNTYFTTGSFRIGFENAQELMSRLMPQIPRLSTSFTFFMPRGTGLQQTMIFSIFYSPSLSATALAIFLLPFFLD